MAKLLPLPADKYGSHAAERTKLKPGRKTDPALLEQVRNLYIDGLPVSEISAQLGMHERTIRQWARKHGWRERLEEHWSSITNIERQIANLSKMRPTQAISMRIAMLTRSLERLRRSENKVIRRPVRQVIVPGDLLKQVLADDYGLYQYQKDALLDESRFAITLKSRQIGWSFILALLALLGAIAGRNQLIISASQEQSDILIEHAIYHATKLGIKFDAQSKSELTIGSAYIKALPANVRTIQGFNGDVYLDEFAWQQNQRRIWGAVVPSVTACGGSVRVSSTPFLPGSLFWELAENHKGQHNQWSRTKLTIHDAIAQGMQVPGGLDELRGLFDSENWAMMYECQWADSGNALLSWELLRDLANMLLRNNQIITEPVWVGIDVGRVNDRTAIAMLTHNAKRNKYQIAHWQEHKGMPFVNQRALFHDIHAKFRVQRMKIDKTGMGMEMAESLSKAYPESTSGVWLSAQRKDRLARNLLKLCEDKMIEFPNDPDLISKLHSVKKIAGNTNIKYDADHDSQGHGDLFWAVALAAEGLSRGSNSKVVLEIW